MLNKGSVPVAAELGEQLVEDGIRDHARWPLGCVQCGSRPMKAINRACTSASAGNVDLRPVLAAGPRDVVERLHALKHLRAAAGGLVRVATTSGVTAEFAV